MNLRDWINRRWLVKETKQMESIADGFWEAYTIALTCHGRYKLGKVVREAEAGNIEIPVNVVGFYRAVLMTAPYEVHALWN